MKFLRHLTSEQANALEYEVLSTELRVHLTRLLDASIGHGDADHVMMHRNDFINMSRSLAGHPVYVLTADDWGVFQPAEHAWHSGEFHLVFRRLSTTQLVELVGDLIERDIFEREALNQLLDVEGASFRFFRDGPAASIQLVAEHETGSSSERAAHPNVRTLVTRMSDALRAKDFTLVLHSSACVFETLAKQVVGLASVQNNTLKSFFERYRRDSKLPAGFLDYVLALYDARNATHLAGHGGLSPSTVTEAEALVMTEMTKAFVRIEYTLNAGLIRPTRT